MIDTPDANAAPDTARQSSPRGMVIAGLFVAFLVCIVVSMILPEDDKEESQPTIRMTGTVLVLDQRVCADGPLLRIHIGNHDVFPIEYPPSNAPCRLGIDHDVEQASRYRFEIPPLPAVVRDANGLGPGDVLEVDVTLAP